MSMDKEEPSKMQSVHKETSMSLLETGGPATCHYTGEP